MHRTPKLFKTCLHTWRAYYRLPVFIQLLILYIYSVGLLAVTRANTITIVEWLANLIFLVALPIALKLKQSRRYILRVFMTVVGFIFLTSMFGGNDTTDTGGLRTYAWREVGLVSLMVGGSIVAIDEAILETLGIFRKIVNLIRKRSRK
jgi:hypothetical protein